MDRPFHLTVQVKTASSAQHVFSQHWIDCSSQANQLSTSSVNTGLIVQVKPASSAQHVDCSSQDSQLSTSSVNTGLIVQVKPASSSHLHLIPCVLYRRSTRLNSTRPVRMSCILVHARPYSKQTTNKRLWITT